jgi:undecaprenyl-phosphate galactose phosphotransferase
MEIHGAVVVPPDSDSEGAIELFSYIHTRVMRMIYVPKASAMDLTNAETGQLLRSQLGYMSVNNALASPLNKLLKRIFDLLLFILITPIVLPIILILMLVVKLTSPGAAIFSHERIGRDGKTFKVYKLRSMYKDSKERLAEMLANDPAVKAEWEAFYKLKDDPRITPLGKFLRKSSLDELPQFFNVFLGNMSFVGPRPVLKDELDRYYKEKTVYYNMATPGITGLWQVSGRNDTTYDDRISMDCWYVFNWSLWLDIVILFSTPLVVIFRRGAY